MKTAGSIYLGRNSVYAALYNSYPDIYSALPLGLDGRHAAHIRYCFGNQHNSIDVYELAPSSAKDAEKILNLKNRFTSRKISNQDEIFVRQDVKLEVINDLRDTTKLTDIIMASAKDIGTFCRSEAKKPSMENPFVYVPEIIPVTAIRYCNVKKPVTSGKADYVDCMLDANLDFVMSKGECVSSFIPGRNSLIQKGSFVPFFPGLDAGFRILPGECTAFSDTHFVGFYHDKSGDCDYCYAAHHHLEPYPKAFVNIDQEQLYDILMTGNFTDYNDKIFGKHVKVLRLGKRTEVGAIYHRKQLVETLETAIRAHTHVVIPTKYLEFDPKIVELYKKAKSSGVKIQLMHSLSLLDDLETGPNMHGCSNEWRIEQNLKYRQAGVDAALFMMTPLSPGDNLERNLRVIEYSLANNIPLQVLGARITKKDVAEAITGRQWEQMKGELRAESSLHDGKAVWNNCGGYALTGNTHLSPQIIAPEILQLIDKNQGQIRLCHHTNSKEYCGSCFLGKGFIKDFKKKESSKKSYVHYHSKKPKELTGKIEGFDI